MNERPNDERPDYVWEPLGAARRSASPVRGLDGAEVDEFAAELERRLAPLGDEVEALVDSLELEGPAEAVILTLPRAHAAAAEAATARERSWPWLAAALVLLCASVLVLARDQRRRAAESTPIVEVGAATEVSGRVSVGVHAVAGEPTSFAVLAAARPAHDELAGCALELEPGAELELRVGLRLGPGVRELDLGPIADPEIGACVRTALEAFDATPLGLAEIELDIHLHHTRSENSEEKQ